MRILLTNDDGIFAPGITALAALLSENHEVYVVAPNTERSGASHSFTMGVPLRAFAVEMPGAPKVKAAYSCSGTPVDCVKLAYGNLGASADLVISGINIGPNLGTDILYSGTAAGAIEGALLHMPSMAVSLNSFTPKHLDAAARVVERIIPEYMGSGVQVYNVNIPDLPYEEIRGIRFTELSIQQYEDIYVERSDPRNQKYYWIPSSRLTTYRPEEDTDERWINGNYATITPLKLDLTDRDALKNRKEILL